MEKYLLPRIIFVLVCMEQEKCKEAVRKMDGHWTAGYGEYEFASNSSVYSKGCYGYLSGKYAGHYFFGTGGSEAEMSTYLTGETFRPKCVKGNIRQNLNVPNVADHTVVFLNKFTKCKFTFRICF